MTFGVVTSTKKSVVDTIVFNAITEEISVFTINSDVVSAGVKSEVDIMSVVGSSVPNVVT